MILFEDENLLRLFCFLTYMYYLISSKVLHIHFPYVFILIALYDRKLHSDSIRLHITGHAAFPVREVHHVHIIYKFCFMMNAICTLFSLECIRVMWLHTEWTGIRRTFSSTPRKCPERSISRPTAVGSVSSDLEFCDPVAHQTI